MTNPIINITPPTLIQPIPVERDRYGFWTHPGMPDGEDNPESQAAFTAWLNTQGLTYYISGLEGEDDAHPTYQAHYEESTPGCVGWDPAAPEGDGWFTLSIHDTEDGPVWVWVRREEGSSRYALANESAILDEHAVDLFAKAMKDKLQLKRQQGFSGWHDISQSSGERLAELLLGAAAKGDPVDVANFAMMLFCRHEKHDALKTTYAAATKQNDGDTLRVNWLDAQDHIHALQWQSGGRGTPIKTSLYDRKQVLLGEGISLRKAIDAAMQTQGAT